MESGLTATEKSIQAQTVGGHPLMTYRVHALEMYVTDSEGATGMSATPFLACDVRAYNIILGFPWLQANNLIVNWKTGT